ncbi:E3 ubiquitin-protein ligase UHRF1 [Lingula anatina]|uniref:RING-type E3 ubiquitin transferase n=1 Tax=Lingula anatina TaxID=7574 RepID=A0A1S3JWM3_LINAN|nr:E3 ubiquitin-protein ligase UHRF1 [Lingula anatina]|eukprot:XP_013414439.1 E3 ubiquitin-protein ligase UHRF1 [Lingula anatina]
MWIQVRSMDGKTCHRIDGLSKLTKIEDLRSKLVDPFDAPAERQRLFYRGKQLEDGHTLFDYDVHLNDIVQLMVRMAAPPCEKEVTKDTEEVNSEDDSNSSNKENEPENMQTSEPSTSQHTTSSTDSGFEDMHSTYKVGDIIDARDNTMGAWFEGKIVKITRYVDEDSSDNESVKSVEKNNNMKEENPTISPTNEEKEQSEDLKVDETLVKNEATAEVTGNNNNIEETMEVDDPQDKEITCDNVTDPNPLGMSTSDQHQTSEKDQEDNTSNNVKDTNDAGNSDPEEGALTSVQGEYQKEQNGSLSIGNSNTSESSKDLISKVELEKIPDDDFIYHVQYEGYEEEEDIAKVRSSSIRPRARNTISLKDIQVNDRVMVNFNYDEPKARGYWYDAIITGKRDTRTIKELYATVFLGADLMALEDCKILFIDEVFAIEKPGSQINTSDPGSAAATPTKRQNKPECDHCLDNPRRKCKHCACHGCGGKNDPDKQIMCDECDMAFHLACLDPPLEAVPDVEEWYCPLCKNDESEVVKAGEKLKQSKKKSKMASANSTAQRDWGRGMACVGRSKICNIVPPNHFGPIPGIEVGTTWKFRVQVSEAGVHRPHVAGIHGRDVEGAYSIVLSGGYEDDEDNGDTFYYTGSGGRDLSGNKRTAEQSCDQTLTRTNRALAKNCNAPLNDKQGGEASDWKAGKPVRVVRNCKGRKHSKYAPEEGNRYDGLYKVVKYWPEKGKSGFIVWRYLFRRDDPTPAPWTKAGKKRIEELGLTIQYPQGYLESQREKEQQNAEAENKKGKGKRKREESESPKSTPEKKQKVAAYKFDPEVANLVKEDVENKKLWKEAKEHAKEGVQKFLAKVEELFLCICCQEIAYKPVTTKCHHNVCKSCLSRSFKAEVYSCPMCRTELGKEYSMAVNKTLSKILNALFPGYENGR